MHDYFVPVAGLIRRYLPEVCLGITAVTMMLSGPSINGFIQKITQKLNWFFRYVVFVVMCAAGYGALAQVLYRLLKFWFAKQHSMALVLITIGIYLVLAFFARKQGHI
jgi:H+/Cl- antiporter ClcA